jgi:hypothetical protein
LIITDKFHPGAYVMVMDDLRSSKMEPRYTGPYLILRRNKGGAYILKANDDTEIKRAPSQMKLVYQDAIAPSVLAEVDQILDHKELNNKTYYLTKWKRQSSSLNQWVASDDFQDLAPIRKYWKAPNNNLKRKFDNNTNKETQSNSEKGKLKIKFKIPKVKKTVTFSKNLENIRWIESRSSIRKE